MKLQRIVIAMVVAVIIMPVAAQAWERSTSSVPPDSSYYRDLDKLIAFGLVEPPIRTQRPYPRGEFARMTAEVMKKLGERVESDPVDLKAFVQHQRRRRQIDIALGHLKHEFKSELIDMGALPGGYTRYRLHPLDTATMYGTYLNSPPTTIPVNNGRGTINAQVNPLRDYNLGRHPIDGWQHAVEADGRYQLGKFFSAYVRPRFEADLPTSSMPAEAHAYLQNAYATFRAGNFSLKVGRDSMVWGEGDRGGLLYSTNPRPLDGVWLTNPRPARLPWIFKHLGRWRYTLYTANLGPGYSQKWGWLAGYKLSLVPAKYVELGFGHTVMIGGQGAPSPTALDIFGEFLGFRPAGTNPSSPNLSNHMFDVDLLVRIPQLRGIELYTNIAIEDKWKSINKTLKHGMSYLYGVYLPALNSSGSLDLRIEYSHLNPLQYRHGTYTDGYTINRRLIGWNGGPDSRTLRALLRHTISRKLWWGVELGWDYRSSDTWTELPNRGDIVKTASGPTEQRFRGVFDIDCYMKKNLQLHLTGGLERASNLNYQQNRDRWNYLLAASFTWHFDGRFAFSLD